MITEGIANFINLTDTEMFNGKDTGKYSIMLTIEEDQVKTLEDAGVVVKEYKNQKQRKFVTQYAGFEVLDVDGGIISKNIPYGSKVRILWEAGKPHPTHGSAPYFKKIKVLEAAEHAVEGEDVF